MSQRKKEGERVKYREKGVHKDEKELLQCFFNMFNCGAGCPGAFVWDPQIPTGHCGSSSGLQGIVGKSMEPVTGIK